MKKKIIIPIILAILVLGYLGVKLFYLNYYNIKTILTEDYKNIREGLVIKDTMTINKTTSNDYLTFKNIKVNNEFKEFKKLENQYSEDTIKYTLYDENNNLKSSFWMSITDNYVNLLKNDKTLFGTDIKTISNDDFVKIIETNNIKTDIELFNYLKDNSDVKNTIFTPIKKMRENYTIMFMIATPFPKLENITLLNGDVEGYILNIKSGDNNTNIKEARIINNDKIYAFTFLSKGNYFSNDDIARILSSVEIETK